MARTLFSKIFLWSVLAQFITVGTILFLVTAYLPQTQEAIDNALALYAETAVTIYERFGSESLDKFLARTGENTLLKLKFAASSSGKDCGPVTTTDNDETTSSILAQGLRGSYCLTVKSKAGGLPETPEARQSRLQITIILELLSCAGLSYFIARYLSRPISELRQAATRLARGDLAARVGAKFSRRHDEAADLVREFDQMAERVAELIKAQQRLISDVSHEIKSPLARLNMALELARRDAESCAPLQFERMQREIETISVLSRELLTLAHLDATQEQELTDRINLADLVSEIIADVGFEAPDRIPDMVYEKPDGEVSVMGERPMLARAIENVVRNAVFYTAKGETIRITVNKPEDGLIALEVIDNGPGVPEETLPYLFAPFFRVDDARTRKTGGTGVGLAICRRSVELHGGTVSGHNVRPHGLGVVIKLPQASGSIFPQNVPTQLHT